MLTPNRKILGQFYGWREITRNQLYYIWIKEDWTDRVIELVVNHSVLSNFPPSLTRVRVSALGYRILEIENIDPK